MGSWYRKSSSTVAMKMFANVGATLVPIAVPSICLYIFPANVNILCSRITLRQFSRDALGKSSSGKCVLK